MACSLTTEHLRNHSPFQPRYVQAAGYKARRAVLELVVEYEEAMRELEAVATWRRRPGFRGLEHLRHRRSPIVTARAYIAGCWLRSDIEHLRSGSQARQTIDPTGVHGCGGGVGYAVPGAVYYGDVAQRAAFTLHALELHAVVAIVVCEFAIIEWCDHLRQYDVPMSRPRARNVMAGGLERLADGLRLDTTRLTYG